MSLLNPLLTQMSGESDFVEIQASQEGRFKFQIPIRAVNEAKYGSVK